MTHGPLIPDVVFNIQNETARYVCSSGLMTLYSVLLKHSAMSGASRFNLNIGFSWYE